MIKRVYDGQALGLEGVLLDMVREENSFLFIAVETSTNTGNKDHGTEERVSSFIVEI